MIFRSFTARGSRGGADREYSREKSFSSCLFSRTREQVHEQGQAGEKRALKTKPTYERPRLVSLEAPQAAGICGNGSTPGGSPPDQSCYAGTRAGYWCSNGTGAYSWGCGGGSSPHASGCRSGNSNTNGCLNGNSHQGGGVCWNGNSHS
jgi:hypothetical protein